ncbi:MAG: hypothetical protein H6642_05530 [Caldilineaceae bacterium]|nr:hypothetical protein [Caldilineaceae bacterium]
MFKLGTKQFDGSITLSKRIPGNVHKHYDGPAVERVPTQLMSPKRAATLQNAIGNGRIQRIFVQGRIKNTGQIQTNRSVSNSQKFTVSSDIAQRLPISQDKVLATVINLYKTAHPMVFPGGVWGSITLSPGDTLTFPDGQERTIIYPSGYGVVFIEDDALYKQPGHAFIREMQLSAISEGAKRATGIAKLAKLEMELIMAMGPFSARLGTTLAKTIVWGNRNYDTLVHLSRWSGTLLEVREILKSKFPHTYDFLWDQMVILILQNLDFELTSSDYAKLIGALIRSSGVEGVEIVANNMWRFWKVISAAFVVTAGEAVSRGTVANIKKKTAVLVEAARQIGIAVSRRDAQRITRELSTPEAIQLLMRLQQAMYAVSLDLKKLSKAK